MSDLHLPRAVVISDMSGFGKCALSVALSLLPACGVEVLPVPTALLSSNMKFKDFFMYDFTEQTAPYLDHIKTLAVHFDAVYTGFLSSGKQVATVAEFIKSSKSALKIVDPIMGDYGHRYKAFDTELCAKITELCAKADIVTPNQTEAHIITGKAYSPDNDRAYLEELCSEIAELGPKTVVITGVERDNTLCNCVYDKNGYREHTTELLGFRMGGTGDMFTSILCGMLLKGKSTDEGIERAQSFISFTMKESLKYCDYEARGVCYEPYLRLLTE